MGIAATGFGYSPIDVLTGLLVLITAIYAALTYSIARSNRAMVEKAGEQIEYQSRPTISVNIVSRHKTVISLQFTNRGNSNATNVRISIDKPFYRFGEKAPGRNIQEYYIFSHPIACIAPGDKVTIDLSQGFNINKEVEGENITPDNFTVNVKYDSPVKSYDEKTFIDIRPYFQSFAGEYEVEELIGIKKQLQSIAKSLERLSKD